MRTHFPASALAIIMIAFAGLLPAQTVSWTNPIISTAGDQNTPSAAMTARNRVVVVWQDKRGANWDVYAQLVDTLGTMMWLPNDGVPVAIGPGDQVLPQVMATGPLGNAIVVWQTSGGAAIGTDLYAQQLDGFTGNGSWGSGVAVYAGAGNQSNPRIAAASTGCYVLWEDDRNVGTSGIDIYAAHILATGQQDPGAPWFGGPIALCSAPGNQTDIKVIPDGNDGFIAVWRDARTAGKVGLYGQKVTTAGDIRWIQDGVKITDNSSGSPSICLDGTGGVLVSWEETRGADADIYAQRVTGPGLVQWGPTAAAVATAFGDQQIPNMITDGAGGAYVAWQDLRSTDADIYIQHIDGGGNGLWAVNGNPVVKQLNAQQNVVLARDGYGRILAFWKDIRALQSHIYGQLLDATGNPLWAAAGARLTNINAGTSETNPIPVVDSAHGFVMMPFESNFTGLGADVRILRLGYVPRPGASKASIDFGKRRVNIAAVDTIRLTNTGNDSLAVTAFSWSQFGAGIFAVDSPLVPFKIASRNDTVLRISFRPNYGRLLRDTLIVSNNNPGADSAFRIPMLGTGVYAHINTKPDTLAFGNVRKGLTKKLRLKLISTGTDTAHVTSLVFNGTAKANYGIDTSSQPIPMTIKMGDTAWVDIALTPTAIGSRGANIGLQVDDSVIQHIVQLTASGTFPGVTFKDPAVSYGKVPITTNRVKRLLIINSGTDTLHIDSTKILDTMYFRVTNGPTKLVVRAGDTSIVDIRFTPNTVGYHASNYVVNADDQSAEHRVPIYGSGISTNMDIADTLLNFGTTPVGTPKDSFIVVRNLGDDTLIVAGATSSSADFVVTSTFPVRVPKAADGHILVSYRPSATGTHSAGGAIFTNLGDTIQVAFTGSATETAVREDALAPLGVWLEQNYPNPFNPSTVISVIADQRFAAVRFEVIDALGRTVATLRDGAIDAGRSSFVWNAGAAPSGVYRARLTIGARSAAVEMTLAK